VGATPPIPPTPPLPLPPRPPPMLAISSELPAPPAPASPGADGVKLAMLVGAVTNCTLVGALAMGLKVDVEFGLKTGTAMTSRTAPCPASKPSLEIEPNPAWNVMPRSGGRARSPPPNPPPAQHIQNYPSRGRVCDTKGSDMAPKNQYWVTRAPSPSCPGQQKGMRDRLEMSADAEHRPKMKQENTHRRIPRRYHPQQPRDCATCGGRMQPLDPTPTPRCQGRLRCYHHQDPPRGLLQQR